MTAETATTDPATSATPLTDRAGIDPASAADAITPFLPTAAGADDRGERLAAAIIAAGLAMSGVLRQEIGLSIATIGPARSAPPGRAVAMTSGERLIGAAFVTDADLVGLADLQMGGAGTPAERVPSALEIELGLRLLRAAVEPVVQVIAELSRRDQITLEPMEERLALSRRSTRVDLAVTGPTAGYHPAVIVLSADALTAADRDDETAALASAFAEVPIEVRVRFETLATNAAELVDLAVGDVLCLDHETSAPLLAEIGDHGVLRVAPGRRGARAAVQVTDAGMGHR
jgi:hypothetical protein